MGKKNNIIGHRFNILVRFCYTAAVILMVSALDSQHQEAQQSSSPLLFGVLIFAFLIALSGVMMIIHHQIIVRQGAALVRNEHKLVSTISVLAREHHRLLDLVQSDTFSTARLLHQQGSINQSFHDLTALLTTEERQPSATAQVKQYEATWLVIERRIERWQQDWQGVEKTALLAELERGEATLHQLHTLRETEFTAHMKSWSNSLDRLNRLLLLTIMLFLMTALLTIWGFRRLIVQRRRADEALRASERRHLALLETIPDIVLRRTRDGIYTEYKPASQFGRFMPSQEFIGKSIWEILPPDIAQLSMAASERALDTGEEQLYEYQMHHRQTGLLRNHEARVTPCGEDEVQVIVRDITEEKQQAAHLYQAQKLESLGVLAGGIAHDFNNLLTGMLAQNSLARSKLMHGLPALAHIEKAITSAERAADLTRQLLAYAGRGNFQIGPLDLNRLIRENAGLLETALPNRAELQLQLLDELPVIEADRGQIQQVVMNLVINAAEALGADGGYVRITTTAKMLDGQQPFACVTGEALPEGAYTVLEVSDNGIGMDEITVRRIFDPFFSTKTRGHGLGLAATLGIIRTHHGGIQVHSEPGLGTQFTIIFPVASTHLRPTLATDAAALTTCDPQVHVLVIDDEAAIREVVTDILTNEGIATVTAASGVEGIAIFREQQGLIGLVLLDLKMPGMSGEETLRELRRIDPTIPVVLSSGYTETEISHHLQSADKLLFLQKPYDISQLLHAVKSLLTNQPMAALVS